MRKKVIAYVGLFPFPYGQAASKRVLGNIILFQNLGYEVIVGHGGNLKEDQIQNDMINVKSYGLGELFLNTSGLIRLFNFLFKSGDNTINWLKSLDTKPDYVIVYGGYYSYANKILKYCKKNNIKIIFDIVEWYEPAQMVGGKYGFFYNSFLLAFKYVYPKADGIIAISSSLKEVFKKNNTVIIPPLVSTKIDKPYTDNNKTLSLIYAGNVGNKDNLYQIIQVVEELCVDNNIKLDILGPSEAELKIKYNIKKFGKAIQIHGKINQEKINNYIEKADFTIFTRPDTHCNKYGFPSKFVESLSLGVPVVTNLNSDIGLYLKDEYNGFVLEDSSKQAIEICIEKILKLSLEQKKIMKQNSIITADEYFSSKSLLLKKNVSKFLTNIDDESHI